MADSKDVTVTIPGELTGWVLDGLNEMMDGLQNTIRDMDDYPTEYDAAERADVERSYGALLDLYQIISANR